MTGGRQKERKERGYELYESAVGFYNQAILLEPKDCDTWYLAHNDAGDSLVMLYRHIDAEEYCRTAMEISPERHNAFMNLGLALKGQDRFAGAARMFADAALRCVQLRPMPSIIF